MEGKVIKGDLPYIKDPMAYQKKVDHDILFCYYCCSI